MAGDFFDDAVDFASVGDYDGSDYGAGAIFASDNLVQGDGTLNSVPTVSDSPQTSSDGGFGSTIQNLLGSVGSVIQNAPQIGTSLGTAVGNAQHNISQGVTNYNNAQSTAASGNKLGTWWQYASTTDKLMVGLAVVGILIALKD